MSLKALVVIAVLLSCLANIQAASVSGTVSVTGSGSVSWSTSGTVSWSTSYTVSITGTVSISSSNSGSISGTPASTTTSQAATPTVANTCSGQPSIICLSWSGITQFTSSFVVTIGGHTFTYPNTQRQVNLVGLLASTAYTVTIKAIDNNGIATPTTSLAVTTGSDTPKTAPKTKGPIALSCSQDGTTAGVKATWNFQGLAPDRQNIQIQCPGIRGRKVNLKPIVSAYRVAGLFGEHKAGTVLKCKCKLRAFFPKQNTAIDYPIPLLKSSFTLTVPS